MKHKKVTKSELEKRLEAEVAEEAARQTEENRDECAEVLATEEGRPEPQPELDIESLLAERDQLKDHVLRSRAEFDNYRKRVAREIERIRKIAAEGLIRDLLPVVDNLERAIEHADDASGGLAQGVEMVLRQLCGVLSQHGVEPIPAVGEAFDPNVHEAVTRMPSEDYPADVVMQEFQKGYRLGAYVLRPTKAVVSAGSDEGGPEETAARNVEVETVQEIETDN